ncbi:hypothetical protein PtrSN002B_003188 [Pyrenophora tritici-repentis]|uniref:Uncharacterized protein n=1 Tax=Pyrenophora tritici-repentis TaxID=45151 RepID=A0A2W1EMU3_9PLEO|nr:hypothetical protein PtrV1_13730 [Pyrenophora tritici-repentis]KAF7569598.1 hypothetical protein PtrM4_120130 [Pyrenophora tritici-repentis]KAI1533556.1 hypothetical protein PtrSN001C_007550 [Pyrenophora tritici-repentis]KAI1536123.1 hypothetical protein PtrSN001A_005757 [Pyrenophora tritici-repentis]KAI1555274.1 hypothetical protein PtrSN002B_003188 [Pyrenophora tritici-repentis]
MVWQEMMGLVARAAEDGSIPDITDPWPVKDIVYVAIIGGLMLAALLEWFLWVAAFLYCIVKVFQKAETISVRILSIFFGVMFFLLRQV